MDVEKVTVMVVDDQEFIRKVLKFELEQLGYNVLTAEDGVDCIEKVRHSTLPISLMILDIMMPRLDGYETCKAIRQDLQETFPIIFLSANTVKSAIIKAIQVGGNDFIPKESDNTRLLAKVKEHLQK